MMSKARPIRARAMRWWIAAAGCALATPTGAQLAPRVTGETVIAQLDAAQHDLAAKAHASSDPQLVATSDQLAHMASDLRATLGGSDATKPADAAKPAEAAAPAEKK